MCYFFLLLFLFCVAEAVAIAFGGGNFGFCEAFEAGKSKQDCVLVDVPEERRLSHSEIEICAIDRSTTT